MLTYLATKRYINTVRLSAIGANSTANRAVEQARDAANQSNETARQANALAASCSVTKQLGPPRSAPVMAHPPAASLVPESALNGPLKDTRRLHGHLLQLNHPAGPATQR